MVLCIGAAGVVVGLAALLSGLVLILGADDGDPYDSCCFARFLLLVMWTVSVLAINAIIHDLFWKQ